LLKIWTHFYIRKDSSDHPIICRGINMGKEIFVGRLLLKRFFTELLGKLLDDGKESRTFLQFKKQKDPDLNYPHILLFHGGYGLGKSTALDHCIQIAKDFCDESKKSLKIIKIDWEDWYYKNWSLPSNNIELMKALHEIFSGRNTGFASCFSRFEDLHSKVKKISSKANQLIRNEWKRDSLDLDTMELSEEEQIKIFLQKKIPKQDLEILDKAESKLAEILITGLREASSETAIILVIDNYEYLQHDMEKWFRSEFLYRLCDLRLITIVSGSGQFLRDYRNVFPEEQLHAVNFSDITLSKLDVLQLAVKNHISITETDAERIERLTGGIPLVVQDLFSYALKGTEIGELLNDIDTADFTTDKFTADIVARFLKYSSDSIVRDRIFHLAMTKQFNSALFAALWQEKASEVNSTMKNLSNQFAFVSNNRVHSLIRASLISYLHQELSNGSDSSLASFFSHYTSVCATYFTDQLNQLQKSILSSEILYSEKRYCDALIGYYCSLMWSDPEAVFRSLPGTFLELIHFNVNFATQLLWHISEFRDVLSQQYTDCLDILYSGLIMADQSLVSSKVPVQPDENAVISFLESNLERMNDFQRSLLFHKKGELLIRNNDFSGAKTFLDNSFSLMDSTSPREILYEDYIQIADEFSKYNEYQLAIESLNNAVSICSDNYLPWFDLGLSCFKIKDYQNAIAALCRSTAINPDFQDTWYYLGLCYGAIGDHEQAVTSFVKAIEKGPESSDICYNMALSLEKTGNNEEAVKTFQKVVGLDPNNVDAWYKIGLLTSILEHSDQAITAFQNAISIKPDLIEAHCALANEFKKTGKFKNAAESFEYAAKLNEKDADLWDQVASSWFSAEQNQKAIDSARKSISLKEDSAKPWVIIGHAFTALGNFSEANSAYTKASEIAPDDASVWVNLGNNFYAQSMYEEAIDSFKKAVSINPSQEGTWFNLGLAYRVKEQYDEALEAFKNAIDQEPSNPECWFQKGRIHMTLNQFEEAAESFGKTVEFSPTSHDAWYKRGLAFAKCSNHPQAIESFTKAAELWSTDPDIWFNMGLSYSAINNHFDAVKSFQEASRLAPSRQEIWYNLGHSFQLLGQFQEAINAYSKSLELLPDHLLSCFNQGVCLYYLADYQQAQSALQNAVNLQPDHCDSLLFLALTCHALGNYQEAISYYLRVTTLKPDSADAWFNMALAYHADNDYDKAIEIYSETVKRWPENSTAWYNLGLVFHARNELDNAIRAYCQATSITEDRPEIWYSLAAAFHSQEHYGEAIQAYRKVTKLSPENVDAHLNLGLAYLVWGDYADAIDSFNKVIKLKPDHLQAFENLCVSYFSAKQYDQAFETGQRALEIDSNELWVMSYVIVACVLTGKISKANEFTDKLIAVENRAEEINRTLYFLNQEIAKNPALQGAQEIIRKLEDAQQDTMATSMQG